MRIIDLPSPGVYTNGQKLRMEAVKAISHVEIVAPKVINAITAIATTNGGTGYTPGTYALTITGAGTGATAEVTVSGGGVAGAVTVLTQGSGYTGAVTAVLPAEAGAGTGAVFTPTVATVITPTDAAADLQAFFTACATALDDYATV